MFKTRYHATIVKMTTTAIYVYTVPSCDSKRYKQQNLPDRPSCSQEVPPNYFSDVPTPMFVIPIDGCDSS